MKNTLLDANFPRDAQGRTYHVGTKPGEVANRIITVGDYTRARRISKSFDGGKAIFEFESHRKFLTLTGTYGGCPITVIAIGMGFSLVDFFVRECRAVVEGDLIIVRFGSCGSLSDQAPIGSIVVPYHSFGVTRNYDHFFREEKGNEQQQQQSSSFSFSSFSSSSSSLSPSSPYHITRTLPCDREVHDSLLNSLNKYFTSSSSSSSSSSPSSSQFKVVGDVTNASADSFYSSQGRQTNAFKDDNEDLIDRIRKVHPKVQTFEMETFLLNHLARSANESKGNKANDGGIAGRIRTGAAQMVFANRETKDFITPEQVEALEEHTGKAVCEAMTAIDIPQDRLHGHGVWSS